MVRVDWTKSGLSNDYDEFGLMVTTMSENIVFSKKEKKITRINCFGARKFVIHKDRYLSVAYLLHSYIEARVKRAANIQMQQSDALME